MTPGFGATAQNSDKLMPGLALHGRLHKVETAIAAIRSRGQRG